MLDYIQFFEKETVNPDYLQLSDSVKGAGGKIVLAARGGPGCGKAKKFVGKIDKKYRLKKIKK